MTIDLPGWGSCRKERKCTGKKNACGQYDTISYVGDGIFVCRYYDSQNEKCEYEED